MENTTQAYNITDKHTTLLPRFLLTLLAMLLLFAIAYLHTQHKATPVTIPQAVELQWSTDSTWTKNWYQ